MNATTIKGQAGYRYGTTTSIYLQTCVSCGVLFGMPSDMDAQRQHDGQSFWCPSGHSQSYTNTDAKKLAAAKADAKWYADEAARIGAERDQLAASRSAIRGVVTRMRNRTVAGECPLCGKHLFHLDRHVKRVHPDFSDETAGDEA